MKLIKQKKLRNKKNSNKWEKKNIESANSYVGRKPQTKYN